jgi:prepilin-type N-terminal cleavage/methylation domain-containing protein
MVFVQALFQFFKDVTMKSRAPAQQKGFTLVEIAIVLVIIGLLLGGVLKGQSLIEGSKVKAMVNEYRGTASAINVYLDKYKAVPGDDLLVNAHTGTGTAPTAATGGNGVIDTGTWVGAATPVATDESSLFWQHTRAAGIVGGATGGTSNTSLGGTLGVTSNAARVTSPAGARGQFVVCASGVPGSIAIQVDTAMDDGAGNAGYVFGATQAGLPIVAATASNAYAQTTTFTQCFQS